VNKPVRQRRLLANPEWFTTAMSSNAMFWSQFNSSTTWQKHRRKIRHHDKWEITHDEI
jgi:hypothetical protein